jgi:undecaprenyl-diphosphatase
VKNEMIDKELFLLINGQHNPTMDEVMAWITARNSWIPFYLIFIGWLWYRYKKQGLWILLNMVISIALADQFTSSLLKPLVKRLRPCHEPALQNLIHLVGNCGGMYGFASSHASNAFAFALAFFLLKGKNHAWAKWLFVWAFVVSYSRMYVGVHYPADILVGALVGCMSAVLVVRVFSKYFPKTVSDS